eukprot:6479121-Amphidinium_carterae.1
MERLIHMHTQRLPLMLSVLLITALYVHSCRQTRQTVALSNYKGQSCSKVSSYAGSGSGGRDSRSKFYMDILSLNLASSTLEFEVNPMDSKHLGCKTKETSIHLGLQLERTENGPHARDG